MLLQPPSVPFAAWMVMGALFLFGALAIAYASLVLVTGWRTKDRIDRVATVVTPIVLALTVSLLFHESGDFLGDIHWNLSRGAFEARADEHAHGGRGAADAYQPGFIGTIWIEWVEVEGRAVRFYETGFLDDVGIDRGAPDDTFGGRTTREPIGDGWYRFEEDW